MKHDMKFKHDGKCFVCGLPTKLLIHQKCGAKMDLIKKQKKAKKYTEKDITAVINNTD